MNREQFKRGRSDGVKNRPAYYGCHFGMRSTLEADRYAYRLGHEQGLRIASYLRKRAAR